MARLLARMLAVLALWLPLVSHGLGLGEINLRSALNQPLEAEIALLALRPDETDSLSVKLASNTTFEQAGIERTSLLSELRFKLEQKATGDYYIRAYTQAPIKEPFLNFLVEVTWSAGRLVREYTVLIDPPTLISAPAPRIQTPRTQSASPTDAVRAIPPPPSAAVAPERFTGSPENPAPALAGNNLTRPRDTLWPLAQRLRPDSSVSTQQMMLALLKANPDAFFEHNINSLRAGHHLRVPDLEEINAISAEQALRDVMQQNAAWADARSRPVADGSTGAQAHLKLLAANDAAAVKTDNTNDAGTIDSVQKQLSLANEAVEAQRQENEDLQSRLTELENQVESMQKLLVLKNESLANLQNKLEEIQPGTATEPTPVAQEEQPQPEPATPLPQPPDAGFDVPKTLHSLQNEIQGNQMLQVVAGGTALLLLALLWLINRRRRLNAATLIKADLYDTPASGSISAETAAENEPWLASIDTDAPDTAVEAKTPLAEIDVYLAYEQYPQAEALLRQLIAKEPERHELKLRLLELFYLTKNKAAFGTAAENLHTALAGAGPLWRKAADMGQELYPEHPLFEHFTAPTSPAADVAPEPPEIMETPAPETTAETSFTLDIPALESAPSQSISESVLLDFEPQPQPAEASEDTAEISLEMIDNESSLTDLVHGLETAAKATEAAPKEPALNAPVVDEASPPLEFSLDDFTPEVPTTSAAEPEPNNGLDFDLEDEAMAMAESDTTTLLDSETDTEEDSALDESSDEVATKLNLARAYLDMGDEEGAASILTEVLEEGNAAQKQEAHDLMADLHK